jgi:hypothetical protein
MAFMTVETGGVFGFCADDKLKFVSDSGNLQGGFRAGISGRVPWDY